MLIMLKGLPAKIPNCEDDNCRTWMKSNARLKENLREHFGVIVVQNKDGSTFGVLKEFTLFWFRNSWIGYWKEFQENGLLR